MLIFWALFYLFYFEILRFFFLFFLRRDAELEETNPFQPGGERASKAIWKNLVNPKGFLAFRHVGNLFAAPGAPAAVAPVSVSEPAASAPVGQLFKNTHTHTQTL